MNRPVPSPSPRQRKRAPSSRALATRARILDAAEIIFAQRGYDGATMRDIATTAGEDVSLVHHHGGGKAALFSQTVARRAGDLAAARQAALAAVQSQNTPTVEQILGAFLRPYLSLAQTSPHWLAYARLVAHVSVDVRWRGLAAEHFDPTAAVFIAEIAAIAPGASRRVIASALVFSVSAMLATVTARQRITTLSGEDDGAAPDQDLTALVDFCVAGCTRLCFPPASEVSDTFGI